MQPISPVPCGVSINWIDFTLRRQTRSMPFMFCFRVFLSIPHLWLHCKPFKSQQHQNHLLQAALVILWGGKGFSLTNVHILCQTYKTCRLSIYFGWPFFLANMGFVRNKKKVRLGRYQLVNGLCNSLLLFIVFEYITYCHGMKIIDLSWYPVLVHIDYNDNICT